MYLIELQDSFSRLRPEGEHVYKGMIRIMSLSDSI